MTIDLASLARRGGSCAAFHLLPPCCFFDYHVLSKGNRYNDPFLPSHIPSAIAVLLNMTARWKFSTHALKNGGRKTCWPSVLSGGLSLMRPSSFNLEWGTGGQQRSACLLHSVFFIAFQRFYVYLNMKTICSWEAGRQSVQRSNGPSLGWSNSWQSRVCFWMFWRPRNVIESLVVGISLFLCVKWWQKSVWRFL